MDAQCRAGDVNVQLSLLEFTHDYVWLLFFNKVTVIGLYNKMVKDEKQKHALLHPFFSGSGVNVDSGNSSRIVCRSFFGSSCITG